MRYKAFKFFKRGATEWLFLIMHSVFMVLPLSQEYVLLKQTSAAIIAIVVMLRTVK